MKTLKALSDIACLALACIAVVVICCFAYYSIFNEDITLGINNVGDQLGVDIEEIIKSDTLSQAEKDAYEERWFMHANFYDNSKGNGIALQELQFNYFMSYRLQSLDYRSTGMQYLGDYKHETITIPSGVSNHEQYAGRYIDTRCYYYDTTNGISWNGQGGNNDTVATPLVRNTQLIIKIDGRPFAIQLNGKEETYRDKRFLGFLWKTGTELASVYYYLYTNLFESVFQAVKSNSAGYGNYYITLDLSKYFTIREYDTETGKFKADNVTDIIKNYAVLKFHYEDNGAISSSQSLFGLIECNRKYAYGEGDNYDTTYWQERFVYTLTEKDLSLRYSAAYDGYFASLSLETKKAFAKMPRAKINIALDLWSGEIIGFDYNAFEGVEINSVKIKGYGVSTFYLLEKCFYNSNLKRLERSAGVILDIHQSAINSAYSEVVL